MSTMGTCSGHNAEYISFLVDIDRVVNVIFLVECGILPALPVGLQKGALCQVSTLCDVHNSTPRVSIMKNNAVIDRPGTLGLA